MQDNVTNAKAAMRLEIRSALAALPPGQRAGASSQARVLLTQQRVWQEAKAILFFAPTAREVDVWPLIGRAVEEGKIAALPRFIEERGSYAACQVRDPAREVAAGKFNIREPLAGCLEVALKRLDLILVPGVAFDLHGRRLGRGKGFYDQMLATVRGTRCGVAFEEQIVRAVPVEPHDIHLNCILTPTRWIEL